MEQRTASEISTPSAAQIGWPALIGRPRFREAVELNAALNLAQKDRFSPILKWVTNDLGRSSTLSRVHQLYALHGEVTVGDVLARARMRHNASDGRIVQVLKRAQAAGLLAIEDRAGRWTARRITIQPLMFDLWRDRAQTEIDAASLIVPAIRPALDRLGDDHFLIAFMAALDRYDGMADALRGPANPGVRLFLVREGGLVMLYDLLLRQPPERARLMTEAPFSRSRLAARFNLSRPHVRRVFAAAAAAGHVCFPAADRIVFAPSLSDEAERHFALTFHVVATVAQAALEGADAARGARADRS